jgi:23S rRNA (uracil1939-C5)-methyltransferase
MGVRNVSSTPETAGAVEVVNCFLPRYRSRFKATGQVIIESISHDGRGVGHVDGKTVFVEGALPGEQVEYGVLRRKPRYDNAVCLRILRAAPERVAQPRCPYFGVCGGCTLQHLRKESQIQVKQGVVTEILARTGRVEPERWDAPIVGPAWGYRRRARLGARLVPKKGGLLLGFRERGSSYLTDIGECPVLDGRVSVMMPALHTLLAGLSCPDRIPQIEVAAGDEDVALVLRHLVALTPEDRSDLRAFARDHGVHFYTQPGGPDTATPLEPEHPPALAYSLPEFDVRIEFGPTDFTQVNADVNRQMVKAAIDWLAPVSGDTVLDLFCGLGNFTLPIARSGARVLGIENEQRLVDGARANAKRNGVRTARFLCGDLYREDSVPAWEGVEFNKLLLDPPRSGAMEVLARLAAPLPDRIVYVSCYPATLARDAEYLVHTLGYHMESARVMDMFPQTAHVEAMALFVRE